MNGLMMEMPLLVSYADRARGPPPRRRRDRLAPRRGRHPPLHLSRGARARAAARQCARTPGRKPGDRIASLAWNGHRHFELFYAVGRRRHGDAHGESAPVPRADRVDHQRRRGRLALHRLDVPAAHREGCGRSCTTLKGVVLMTDRRPHGPRAPRSPTCSATRSWSRPRRRTTNGRRSTRTPPAAFATRRAPPAIPRARSTATAPPSCTPTATCTAGRDGPVRRATACCRSCPCSTPTPGACRTRRRWCGAKIVFPGAALDGKSLHELFEIEQVTLLRRRADGVDRACCSTCARAAAQASRRSSARWSAARRARRR